MEFLAFIDLRHSFKVVSGHVSFLLVYLAQPPPPLPPRKLEVFDGSTSSFTIYSELGRDAAPSVSKGLVYHDAHEETQ